jgi:hypothetical protein
MAFQTPEQIREKTAALKKKLAEGRASMDAEAQRKAGKKIRRLQRKRRKVEVEAQRLAAGGKKKKKKE